LGARLVTKIGDIDQLFVGKGELAIAMFMSRSHAVFAAPCSNPHSCDVTSHVKFSQFRIMIFNRLQDTAMLGHRTRAASTHMHQLRSVESHELIEILADETQQHRLPLAAQL